VIKPSPEVDGGAQDRAVVHGVERPVLEPDGAVAECEGDA
jgi:hypothetical protein